MTSIVTVFIFLLWFILFWRKIKKGIPLNREEKILAYLGSVLLIVSVVFQIFQFFNITPSFLAPYSLPIVLGFALVGIAIIALFLISRHSKKIQLETTMRRTPRLRFSVRKEKRMDVLMVAFVLVIFGPTLIMMILSFPSEPLSPQESLSYQVMKIIAIGMGISFTMLGIWMVSNLFLNVWGERKQSIADRNNALQKIVEDFDKSFRDLKQATQQKTKKMLLDDFQNKLRDLCYEYPWNEEKSVRITEVLNYIPNKFIDNPNANSYLLFLGFIVHREKDHTTKMIREKFLVELEKSYNNPQFETDPKPIGLLQELHEYSEEYMMKLIDDASSTTKWSDQKFQALGKSIELWELKKKDIDAHARISQYIISKMEDAEKNNDEVAWKRLVILCDLTKR